MAQFCINIADEQIGLVIGSMCGIYGYVAMVPNPDPSNHPNPDFNPNLPEGPDNLKSIPFQISNPDYDPGQPEYIYNLANIPNPNFNPELEESPENLSVIPNPDYNPSLPEFIHNSEFIANPAYNPPAMIGNPETAPQFVNRKVREWLTENVKAYQAQVAAEAARQAIINSTNITITDPYI